MLKVQLLCQCLPELLKVVCVCVCGGGGIQSLLHKASETVQPGIEARVFRAGLVGKHYTLTCFVHTTVYH